VILPTKHIRSDRALIGVGAEALKVLHRPTTVSRLWDDVRQQRASYSHSTPISYDWFILALDLLFLLGAIEFERGLIQRVPQ
jgi:hypothetical protein